MPRKYKILFLLGLGFFVFDGWLGFHYLPKREQQDLAAKISSSQIVSAQQTFVAEVYDTIQKNYWDQISDEQLSKLFLLGANKVASSSFALSSNDRVGVLALVAEVTDKRDEQGRNDFAAQLANIVLVNLQPFGRSSLYTAEQKKALIDKVSNKDESKDLYKDLGVPKDASREVIDQAYKSQPKTEEREYAHKVLTSDIAKTNYDKSGAQPTVFSKMLTPKIAYIRIQQISPQTFDEFIKTSDAITDKAGLNTLVLDLRDNIGGVIDAIPYFMGPFIGPNQYAYDFFHQKEYVPYRTKYGFLPSLAKYKRVVVLVNDKTQSSAEVMAASLKKYRAGIVVGTKTKGWGTIEQIIPIKSTLSADKSYSALIVQSITLREDNQPIEGRGVEPNVDITQKGWQQKFAEYYSDPALFSALEQVWRLPPKY